MSETIHINKVMSREFAYYCKSCGEWSNEVCDCCLICMTVVDDCGCEE